MITRTRLETGSTFRQPVKGKPSLSSEEQKLAWLFFCVKELLNDLAPQLLRKARNDHLMVQSTAQKNDRK